MTSQHMIYNHPLLNEIVKQYQESRGLQSWSAAATELLIRGIQGWIDSDKSVSSWATDELALNTEYKAWRKEQIASMGYDPSDYHDHEPFMEEEEYSEITLYRFMLDKVSPKRGGKRSGQGRPKGSKNKPK